MSNISGLAISVCPLERVCSKHIHWPYKAMLTLALSGMYCPFFTLSANNPPHQEKLRGMAALNYQTPVQHIVVLSSMATHMQLVTDTEAGMHPHSALVSMLTELQRS